MPALLSLCMIVKNEAAHLARCLDSVAGVADEIVVADTGSSDGTRAIALARGARVIDVPWRDDFSAARNASLDAARGRWILILDADEYLAPGARDVLRPLLQGPARAYRLLVKNSADGGRTGALARIVRLFPHDPAVRFEWPIHEQVNTSLARAGCAIGEAEVEIIHTGYSDPARVREKQRRNRQILEAQVAAGHAEPLTWYLLGGANLDLEDFPAALAAYARCRSLSDPAAEIAQAAAVRLATTLARLQRDAEAWAAAPAAGEGARHPEVLILRGEIEARAGRPESARAWFEQVLGCPDRAYLPPCDAAAQKIRAVQRLGTYWLEQRGQRALALALLRSAVECHKKGLIYSPALLAEVYQAHGQPAGWPSTSGRRTVGP